MQTVKKSFCQENCIFLAWPFATIVGSRILLWSVENSLELKPLTNTFNCLVMSDLLQPKKKYLQ